MTTLTRTRRATPIWLVPTGLILLSLIPSLAGSVRLGELASSTTIDAGNARFFDSPIPVITHIVSVVVYSLLGAFQFVTWRRRRRWHRVAGRILIPAGLLAALSGLWMTLFYELPSTDGPALVVIRLVFGVAMVTAIVLGIRSIRRREFITHGAWMTRAYALGAAAGTQAIVLTAASLLVDTTHPDIKAPLMALSWIINVVVAEWVIRRRALARVGGTR